VKLTGVLVDAGCPYQTPVRCRTPVIPAAYLLSGIRRGAIKSTWSLVAIELVRSVRVLDVREAGSRSRPQVLRFTPAGFGEQPEQHHDQCWRQEGDQPGYCEPVAAAGHYAEGDQAGDPPSTPAASDQPATEALTGVGNTSLTSAPAAGAKTEAANTPRM